MNEEALFDAAIAISDLSDRNAFLDRECAGDPELRGAVERLLSCHDASNPLDRPAFELATQSLSKGHLKSAEPMIGKTIGRYKLLEKIGEGGFGTVWLAEQRQPIVRRVALKVIKLGMDTKEFITRFEAERQALALMDHPGI